MSTGNRAERRTATLRSITRTARELLVAEGAHAVRLRAIARALGLTAPALYRYVSSHEDLMALVVGELYEELSDAIERAAAEPPGGDARESRDLRDPRDRLGAAARAFRGWAVAHPREFGLVFANPVPALGADQARPNAPTAPKLRFAAVFGTLFTELWERQPFPVPDPADLDPAVVEQLERGARVVLPDIPIGAVHTFVWCWSRLYGAVCLEVFGHLDWAVRDAEPLFTQMLDELGVRLAPPLTHPPKRQHSRK
jgi:AcrR family transcriptional regulator